MLKPLTNSGQAKIQPISPELVMLIGQSTQHLQ